MGQLCVMPCCRQGSEDGGLAASRARALAGLLPSQSVRPACCSSPVQGSEDGGLAANARTLAGLLERRPQGSTRFVELQVAEAARLGRRGGACREGAVAACAECGSSLPPLAGV